MYTRFICVVSLEQFNLAIPCYSSERYFNVSQFRIVCRSLSFNIDLHPSELILEHWAEEVLFVSCTRGCGRAMNGYLEEWKGEKGLEEKIALSPSFKTFFQF